MASNFALRSLFVFCGEAIMMFWGLGGDRFLIFLWRGERDFEGLGGDRDFWGEGDRCLIFGERRSGYVNKVNQLL